jgi:hypothetical protein
LILDTGRASNPFLYSGTKKATLKKTKNKTREATRLLAWAGVKTIEVGRDLELKDKITENTKMAFTRFVCIKCVNSKTLTRE